MSKVNMFQLGGEDDEAAAAAGGDATPEIPEQDMDLVCQMLFDVIEVCSGIYGECLDHQQMR